VHAADAGTIAVGFAAEGLAVAAVVPAAAAPAVAAAVDLELGPAAARDPDPVAVLAPAIALGALRPRQLAHQAHVAARGDGAGARAVVVRFAADALAVACPPVPVPASADEFGA